MVCLTITGDRTEVAGIGVYLVILGLERDPDEDLVRDRFRDRPLNAPRERPLTPLAVWDSSNITRMTRRIRKRAATRTFYDSRDKTFECLSFVFQVLCDAIV